ncbi:prepilin-type N-terminal cleavage/methylation domain-containing protein [Ferrimonas lipolytica]|uniref:Prepilin-type N-terminal cleavage/methylation domain-containing protein n=1 Tax=Ferrimonas lipolytica TaxID=2724191 RepID=A0A6H1UEW4_9GAMM|nr:prepilin-type N-terminal cleavage/methylation domain-containing protein [Ferrimonas lipolytica]QIZ77635.1 prepilin-type N-terminal cleavage/methylation domain-containing protein [Ferrimonas lipolytica]
MLKQKGFTLIELVIVIVVIAILAAVAAPKFIDISRDARIAVIDNLYSSVQTAADQTYLKAILVGVEADERSDIEINGTIVQAKYGYPEAHAESDEHDIIDLLNISEDLMVCNGNNYPSNCTSGSSQVVIGYDLEDGEGCYVHYSEPNGTGAPADGSNKYGLVKQTKGC